MAVSKLLLRASLHAVFLSLSVIASVGDNNGGGYYDLMTPKLAKEEKLLSTMIGIQGIILYKFGSTIAPLQGAVARITCKAVDEYGYEAASYSFLSESTDANGYFLATLSSSEVEDKRELRECRAFLELSPLENCQSPSDLNNGVSGARSSPFLQIFGPQQDETLLCWPFPFHLLKFRLN